MKGFTLIEALVTVSLIAVVASILVVKLADVRLHAETTAAVVTLQTAREAFCGDSGAPGYLDDMGRVPGFAPAAMGVRDLLEPSRYPDHAAYDPGAKRGWRGPYLRSEAPVLNSDKSRVGRFPSAGDRRFPDDLPFQERGFFNDDSTSCYGTPGDAAAGDPWGNPLVLQVPPASAFAAGAGGAERVRFARLVSAGPDGVLQTPRDRLAGRKADGLCPLRGDDLVLFLFRPDSYESE